VAVALTHLRGRSIGVFGLARSGMGTVAAAVAGGAEHVLVWDDRDWVRQEAEKLGATPLAPEDWPWKTLESLVLSPGVPLTHPAPHPVVSMALAAGVAIISDIELLWREAGDQARFVAITGTNGKSTTTALIGHVLKAAGLNVSVGGNIGRAALDLEPPGEGRVYAIEMSSYQLDLTDKFRPDVAVWLESHSGPPRPARATWTGYRQAKACILANMTMTTLPLLGLTSR
jgi:UDP-N-acetylmuramoylalanine--D-glutamate ligase